MLAGLVCLVPRASAQTWGSFTLNVPPAIAANTATNLNLPIDMRENRWAGLLLSATNASGADSVYCAQFARGDGTLWESQPFLTISMTVGNGTTGTLITNFDAGAFGWVQCTTITNGAGSLSNCLCQVLLKPGR
jgi:hypothetical protein